MYEVIEKALVNRIVAHFSEELSETRVVAGDLDTLFNAVMSEGASYGCLIDYANGGRMADSPYNGKMWSWSIECYILIRYEGDPVKIEQAARDVIDKLFSLLDIPNHTLEGTTPLARVMDIARPDPTKVNDIPFYWIPFRVEALEKV